MEDKLNCVV